MAAQRLYENWLQRFRWSSLHGRVLVFTTGVVLLLLIALGILINVLRRSQLVLVTGVAEHTDALARSLARAYEERQDRQLNLDDASFPTLVRLPQINEMPESPVITPSVEQADAVSTSAITVQVLRDEKGVEGGFYRSSTRTLGAYAFPMQEHAGAAMDRSEQEMPTLLRLGAKAAETNHLQRTRFVGSNDIVVFAAYPICDTRDCKQGTVGAVWTVERLPYAASDQRKAIFWGCVGFSAIALFVVALAYSVLANVERSTGAVLARLSGMETDFSQAGTVGSMLHLFEFQTMLNGLERLGTTLTERMKSEQTLQDKLRHSERLASIGRLAAGVAHELRSPLATIRFRAQMTQRAVEELTAKTYCEVILAEVDRLNGIIERLLAFSRPIQLRRQDVDLAELCEEVVDRWRVQLPEVSISSLCLEASPLLCSADRSRMRQALDNIVENAAHVLREEATSDPWICLECEHRDDCALIHILDNGGGFSPEALHRGTEPFFTTRTHGTGLGLAVTHEIIAAHQGTLTVKNRGGEGATITFSIPLQPALAEMES